MMDKKHAIVAMVLEGKKVYRIDWDQGTWVEYDEKKRCFINENGFDVDLNAYCIDETWEWCPLVEVSEVSEVEE